MIDSVPRSGLASPEYLEHLKNTTWTKDNYSQFIEHLKNYGEESYKNNMMRLIPTKYDVAGIRMGHLRQLAQVIARSRPQEFLAVAQDDSYESLIIQAYIMGLATLEYQEFLDYLNAYIPMIDNWALADMTIHYKIIAKDKETKADFFEHIKTMLASKNPWEVRVGLVALLKFYIDDEYIEKIIEHIIKVSPEQYYVRMGLAWLIATVFEKYEDKTLELLRSRSLENVVTKLVIRKIKEARRTTDTQKEIVNDIRDSL